MASTEPHAGPRPEVKANGSGTQKPAADPPAWPSHDLIRRNAAPSIGERAGAVRPGPLPGSNATDAAVVAAAIRAAELEAETADVTAAELEAAEAAEAELAAADQSLELDAADIADAPGLSGSDAADTGVTPSDGAVRGSRRGAAATGRTPDAEPAPTTESESIAELRRPTKFMADLTAAMRAAAEAARVSTVGQLRADATARMENIQAESTIYTAGRREQAEEDVTAIREWSKAEIARIHALTEENIATRQRQLDEEVIEQAARLEAGVSSVQLSVSAFEERMDQFFARLLEVEDPSRFATMAGQLPEPPPFEPWSPVPEAPATAPASAPAAETGSRIAAAPDQAEDGPPRTASEAAADADSAPIMALVAVGPGGSASGVPVAEPGSTVVPAQDEDTTARGGTSVAVDSPAVASRSKAGDNAPAEVTQVVVVGLVSVASIATFKRMISRTAGVKSVHVSSGPEGEFIFSVTHQPAVDLPATIAG